MNSPETSVGASSKPAPDNEEQALQAEVEKLALALCEAIEENTLLKQNLQDLEQLIKRLDVENMTKSAALLIYNESQMSQLEEKIENQKEDLKRKTDECDTLEQKNQEKMDNLKQTNQVLKTCWEENVQKVADLKAIEEEIEELTLQLCECKREIKSIDRKAHKQAAENSNQFQVVRSRSLTKKPNLKASASNAIEMEIDGRLQTHE
ncbi:hypothetical protein PtA15_13A512 [Puccinia triticina]|uniref:Autophagy-related protein 16 domain-containing protein n=1 Tax=Puccinia triticina TaxID=208348 RepID=A0ABY7D123_9BASI|nr:uncharacterized protein PtA15_13A512 [Puccinia triticina]WAQ91111.1 hypothetical protein PtA15_13A512 [Puccinia triticina]